MKNRKPSAAAVCLCLVLGLLARPLTVHASQIEPPDLTDRKTYSIKVMMVYNDKSVEGGSFEAYRVGEIVRLKNYARTGAGSASQGVETAGDTYRFWPTESLLKSMGYEAGEIEAIKGIDKDDPEAEKRLNAILGEKLGDSELNGIGTAAQKEKLAKALAAYVQQPEEQEDTAGDENAAGEGENGGENNTQKDAAVTIENGPGTEDGGTKTGEDNPGTEPGDGGDGDDEEPEVPDLWGEDHAIRENENGTAAFEQLRTGLYLFTQSAEQASPGYYPVEPFLVSVPVYDNEYNYKVQAFPNDNEVKIYVKFRLMAIEPDPPDQPDPPPPPGPGPEPEPPGPEPNPPKPEPDPKPEPAIERWVQEYLADPLSIGEEKPEPRLPQTGQINWPVPVFAAGGAVLFLAGVLLRQYGKKTKAEKNHDGIKK